MQQQDLRAAAAATAEAASSMQQQQQQAEARSNKEHRHAEVRSILRSPAPAGISALIFSLSSSSATKQNNKDLMKKKIRRTELLLQILAGRRIYCSPSQRLTKTDLAFCGLRISTTTRPASQSQLHGDDQGKIQP